MNLLPMFEYETKTVDNYVAIYPKCELSILQI